MTQTSVPSRLEQELFECLDCHCAPFYPHSQDYVPANRLKLFLRSLDMQEFYTYNIVKGTKVVV